MLLQTTILFQPTKLRKIFDICKSSMQIFAKMGEKNEEFNGKRVIVDSRKSKASDGLG